MSECFSPKEAKIDVRSPPFEGVGVLFYLLLPEAAVCCQPCIQNLALKHVAISLCSIGSKPCGLGDTVDCLAEPFLEVLLCKDSNTPLIKRTRITDKLGLRDGHDRQSMVPFSEILFNLLPEAGRFFSPAVARVLAVGHMLHIVLVCGALNFALALVQPMSFHGLWI